ncbi:MAG TPA: chalcone isomerase family protein [Polyangia bacterium]|nr:chalcone isomerase family protein [Polyangia bacterium]
MKWAIVGALVCSLASGARGEEEVAEPSTGHEFPVTRTADGHTLMLLGTGVRKKIGFKVYAMALYVDEVEARRNFPPLVARAGGRSRAALLSGDHASQFAIWGAFDKVAILHFVRNVGAEKIKDAFQEGLEDELSEKSPAEMRKAAEAFVAMFDKELKDGQEIELRTDGDGHITVTIAGEAKDGPRSAKLARAIWSIWLGPKTISADMRKSLVDRIDQLGK